MSAQARALNTFRIHVFPKTAWGLTGALKPEPSNLFRIHSIRNFMSHPKKKQLGLYYRHLGSTALMRLELQRIMVILSVGGKLFEVAPSRQQKRKISIHHPDVTSLDDSNLNDKLMNLQLGEHM